MRDEHIRALAKLQATQAPSRGSGYCLAMPFLARCALLFTLLCVASACTKEPKTASIGAILSRDNETGVLLVREVMEGNAAAQAGLLAGDELVMIDGIYVRDLDTSAVRAMLRGEVGTKVHITAVRGQSVLRVTIERGALLEAQPPKPRIETIAE